MRNHRHPRLAWNICDRVRTSRRPPRTEGSLYKRYQPMTLYVSTPLIGIPFTIALYLLTTPYALHFDPNMAHAAHDMVSRILAVFQGYYFNRVRGIVGTHDHFTLLLSYVPTYPRPLLP